MPHRFHQFSVGGPPEAVWQGDWIAGKGIGLACLDTPQGRVHVYNTHTCANYGHGYQHVDADGKAMAMLDLPLFSWRILTFTQHACSKTFVHDFR